MQKLHLIYIREQRVPVCLNSEQIKIYIALLRAICTVIVNMHYGDRL